MYEQEQLTLSQVILEEGGLRGGGLDQGVLDEHVLGLGEMKICSRWELVKIKRSSWKEYGRRSEIYICDQLVCGSAQGKFFVNITDMERRPQNSDLGNSKTDSTWF